jgi:hypothetical protein
MLLEQKLAAYLTSFADRTPTPKTDGDAFCLARFKTHSSVALAGSMAATAAMGWKMIDPKLLSASPPRVPAFAAQFALVSGAALLMAFYSTRFTSIQCVSCLMGVDSELGHEARRVVGSVNVNQKAFWELAKQIAGEDRKGFVEGERQRWMDKKEGIP